MKPFHGRLATSLKWIHSFTRSNSSLSLKTSINSSQILGKLSNPSQMKQILAQIIIQNQHLDQFYLMKFIDICATSNGFTSSAVIFSQFHEFFDSFVCNSVLRTYTHLKKYWHSIFVYVQMHKHGISPDLLTFPAVIKSTAHLGRRRLGKSLQCCVIKMGFGSDLFANTALVHMYCSCLSIDDARRVFDEMPERNSVSWNALITGYVHGRRFLEAFDVFRDMMRDGVELREVTMVGLLSACANLGALDHGRWVHDYIRQNGLALNVYVGTALIDMYSKCGNLEEGFKVFKAMKVKNVCTWNVLISAYSMNGRGEDALMAFYSMVFDDYKPDDVTFLAVLSACFHEGLVGEGRSHFRSMKEEFGVEPKMEHYGCMIDLLSRADLIDEAMELIRTMPLIPDPTIWRALLRAFQFRENFHLVELVILKLVELEPQNGDNFFLLSNLCIQQQRWAEVEIVREMTKDRGIQNLPGYSSVVINSEIYEFIASYDIKPGLEEIYKVLACMAKNLRLSSCVTDSEML
ncbi:pentatricopeptide repeat-containing protein At2g02980, chloroplastic-like [Chenopodium quinoa]|nr:pentatricopeptide repeat-containing protein At2g02980, chloroplastic-like [Chenopodium quinoa]